ncbi:Murein DD-endopeptidase MepM and murein hydrolase activator NlpD, contain LysM domain [Poseidonocella pacifica]|uniref:Murein DD-endopeptidase MepM and murein hydrolase activator NlpD, contain LysM domain n=1 Tax=Poseidonocella pacifica TaxID=871651 RepID=A0A1I0V999_9RHOB|nr:M23 family metallopeptidase [Poseidonocella pacifica]SFA72964.1 Murein DD-endopeptidase MepM and murein hydrolase activator NlpD, contain LysM domain [Poseidonocella pacifica]
MISRFRHRLDTALERILPERRLFLRSDTETRFIRLKPTSQLVALAGSTAVIGWAIVATAVLTMDSIGSGNFRDQAKRDLATYQARLNALSEERDTRAEEARAAQERFTSALAQISTMQSELLASEEHRRELEKGIDVIQVGLRRTMKERDAARMELLATRGEGDLGESAPLDGETAGTLAHLTAALERTAKERDSVARDAELVVGHADELALRIRLMEDSNDQIFRQLEEAMTVSVEPLDKMFRSAGLDTDTLLSQVKRRYSGQGGPLTPITSTMGQAPGPDALRANGILQELDRLNLYRIAAEKAPFALPVKNAYRFTSPFGYRRDPKTGGRRMHQGVDFAAPSGTPLYSTADGVVIHAGWSSGYGRLVKIKHDFGIETRFAHLSKLRVKVGDRVSRGDRIGDMGASGRVTGVHLHYEVLVNGTPVNPMSYIKAARDVF